VAQWNEPPTEIIASSWRSTTPSLEMLRRLHFVAHFIRREG